MRAERQYMVGLDKDAGGQQEAYYWTGCGWSVLRTSGKLFDRGTAETVIAQQRDDEIWSYLI